MSRSGKPSPFLYLFVSAVVCALLGVAGPAFTQPSQQEQDSPLRKALNEAKWVRGPSTAPLEKTAEIRLPENYVAANGDDTRRIMEGMHNLPSGMEVGMVFPGGLDWFVVFEYDEMGYVKDDEKQSLDANAMLESIRRGTEEGNKERAKRGWPAMRIVGWEQPPRYDDQTHNLTWAIRGESQGGQVVNYNTRLLGRKGVMRVTLVTDPERLPTVLPDFRSLISGYSFVKGSRYAEWVPGDKVAQIGLTALVTGGAAAVAVKSGLLKYLWKILLVGGAAVLVLLGKIRKLFARNTVKPNE
jgi:uncharacterized membrane-anchored protein